MPSTSRLRTKAKLALACAALIGTLLALEVGLRVVDTVRGDTWDARTAWYWGWERDPFLGYRGRGNVDIRGGKAGRIRHNEDGFHDERTLGRIRGVAGRRLIVCVGESSTYGIGTPDARDAYPARLEVHLRALDDDERTFVFNAGVPGYTSHETVGLLHLRLLKHRPDAVVMMNLNNDVAYMAKWIDDVTDYGSLPLRLAPIPVTSVGDFFMRSSLVGFVANRFVAARPSVWHDSPSERAKPVTDRGLAFYLDNLATAALLCRRAKVPLVLVDQPIFDDTFPAAQRRETRRMRDAMKAAARDHGLALLDADRPLHDSGFTSPHDVHLGKVGYDKLAAILAPQLRRTMASTRDR